MLTFSEFFNAPEATSMDIAPNNIPKYVSTETKTGTCLFIASLTLEYDEPSKDLSRIFNLLQVRQVL